MKTHNAPFDRPSCRGFTLIELLTVIAIIGILAAILIPVVGKVRQSAYSAKTTSNLRQLFQANRMHAADWKGAFCPFNTKNGTAPQGNQNFLQYIGSKEAWWEAASMLQTGAPGAHRPNDGAGVTLGMSMGEWIFDNFQYGFKDADVDRIAPQMIMFGDSSNYVLVYSGANGAPASVDTDAVVGWSQVAFRYGGNAHFMLANGKVVKLSKADVTAADKRTLYWPQTTSGNPWSNSVLRRVPAPY